MNIRNSTRKSPLAVAGAPFRRLADNLYLRRDGLDGWQQHRNDLRSLMSSTPEQVAQQSLDKLRDMLIHAYATVPYYREKWTAIGFAPSPHTTLDDLRRLPLLPKSAIRERKADLVSQSVPPADLRVDYTGGTTGTQTSFYRNSASTVAKFGRQRGILERCGYRQGDRRGMLWGAHSDLPDPDARASLKRWLRRFASADEILCCTVMGPQDMLEFHDRLRKFRPVVLYGYANAIEQFARFIVAERLSPIRVGRVFCTAELLRDSQRALFRDVFGAEVFNLYCSREHGCVGFECERHDRFHIDSGSVHFEILHDGRPAVPGESGQIVITDLFNRGMPLIRYLTGDLGTAATGVCECGCPLPTFSRLDGRVADVLYRPDGSTVSGVMVDDLFMEEPRITHAQFVQEDAASVDVYLVLQRGTRNSAALQDSVVKEVRGLMGAELRIGVHFVPDVVRNPRSGKFQTVISRIPRQDYARVGAR